MTPQDRVAALLAACAASAPATLAAALAAPDHPAKAHLAALAQEADAEDEAVRSPAIAALFGGLVEPLNDSFTPAGRALYAELFPRVVWPICAARPPLRAALAAEGVGDLEGLLARYRSVRARALADTPWSGPAPRAIAVLSRVTIGADILLTSVAVQRLAQRFPQARLHLLGDAKLAGLFGGLPGLTVEPIAYPRRGPLGERLGSWLAVRERVRALGCDAVVAPDSRLDQLGILPVGDPARSLLWENLLPPGAPESLATCLDRSLARRLGLPPQPACLPRVAFDAATAALAQRLGRALGPGPWAAVKLDHGGNPAKALPRAAEVALLHRLRAQGWRVLLDRGFGPAELANSDALLAAAALPAVDVAAGAQDPGRPLAALADGALAEAPAVRLAGSIAAWGAGVAHCRLALSYDSVGHHLAAALGVPVVVAFTGYADAAFPIAWQPRGPGPVQVVPIATAAREQPSAWSALLDAIPPAAAALPLAQEGP